LKTSWKLLTIKQNEKERLKTHFKTASAEDEPDPIPLEEEPEQTPEQQVPEPIAHKEWHQPVPYEEVPPQSNTEDMSKAQEREASIRNLRKR
jgi:hypothetical protein